MAMIRNIFVALLLFFTINSSAMTQTDTARIRHTVVFKLKHPKGSAEEQDFFTALMKLSAIPGVEKFECMKQVSRKNNFEYGLSMEFANQQAYDKYNNNPEHVAFVQKIWLTEVENFMELDFIVPK
jgi:hypothetical protein